VRPATLKLGSLRNVCRAGSSIWTNLADDSEDNGNGERTGYAGRAQEVKATALTGNFRIRESQMGATEVERGRESLLVAPGGHSSPACCECSPSAGGIRENGEVCRARPMNEYAIDSVA